MKPQSTVLVTGAAGFIGSAVSACLAGAGHNVVAYDNLSRGRREYLPAGTTLIEADVRDGDALADAVARVQPDAVVHLAAMHFIPDCIARPAETMAINVDGTRRLLDACRRSSVTHVVFASTAAVYAPSDQACVETSTPLGPIEIYGESKVRRRGTAAGVPRRDRRVGDRTQAVQCRGTPRDQPACHPAYLRLAQDLGCRAARQHRRPARLCRLPRRGDCRAVGTAGTARALGDERRHWGCLLGE